MRMMFLSSEIYLSIEEIALGKGGVPASKEGKTSSVGISHGFDLRTAVDLIAETRRDIPDPDSRYLT